MGTPASGSRTCWRIRSLRPWRSRWGDGGVTPALVASRALRVLDEHRVPYGVGAASAAAGWERLTCGRPGCELVWPTAAGPPLRHDVGGIAVWAHVAPETAVAHMTSRLPGTWRPATPVITPGGELVASVWRNGRGGTVLPFDPDAAMLALRSERYLPPRSTAARTAARRSYYAVRPLVPRSAQLAARRAFTRIQSRAEFPAWPAEPALHRLGDLVLRFAADVAGVPLPRVAPWPRGKRWALVLTHDVETRMGRDGIARVRAVEARSGVGSSWNFVPERYEVPDDLVAGLPAEGCEIGVHGLKHDGRDLVSERTLRRRLPQMRDWAERWGAVGFRAPATQRRWEWMPQLGFDYDSSYPDCDPYEPIAGGCCSWLPFFNEDLVELPITVPQDHTVFVILRAGQELWSGKAELLRREGGMALMLTHPDYLLDDALLGAYERFVAEFSQDRGVWNALPHEVSAWWRRRRATVLECSAGEWRAVGPAAAEAAIELVQPSPEAMRDRADRANGRRDVRAVFGEGARPPGSGLSPRACDTPTRGGT
jgi:peptidoglycan/xylan/chitin deacetylase (PgdA/CDA1 family)